jgi:hypothetical protein
MRRPLECGKVTLQLLEDVVQRWWHLRHVGRD